MLWGPIYGKGLDPTSIAVYGLLGTFGTYNADTNIYQSCYPSRRRMSILLGCSASKIDRALAELVKTELITRTKRYATDGSQLPSEYTVVIPKPLVTPATTNNKTPPSSPVTTPLVTGDNPPLVTGDNPPSSPVTNNQEVFDPNSVNQEKTSPYPSVGLSPSREARPKEEEEISPRKETQEVSPDAVALVRALPPIHGDRPATSLALLVSERLTGGWSTEALRRELVRDLGTAKGTGVYHARLKQLPETPPMAAPQSAPARSSGSREHAWVEGGPNGACVVCGASQLASQHQHHQELARRSARRCEHGRIRQACPACRDAGKAVESAAQPTTGGSGATAQDPRLMALLGAFTGAMNV